MRLLADGADTGRALALDAAGGWSGTFSGLDRYRDQGVEVAYTVAEDEVEGYATTYGGDAVRGFEITNAHVPSKTRVSVRKVWDDADDADGLRPASVTVRLLAGGTPTGETVELSEANGWRDAFVGLDRGQGGETIVYTVAEEQVRGYEAPIIEGDAERGFEITNTHVPSKTRVSVRKVWDDADKVRPPSVTVQLLADGVDANRSLTLSDANGWSDAFKGLERERAGREIAYTVAEVPVPGYEDPVVAGDAAQGFTVTNRHVPGTTVVRVRKVWDDAGDADKVRPASVTVRLLADGADTGRSLTLDAANGWRGTFSGLERERDGRGIAYTVAEDAVDGYATKIEGTVASGFTVTNSHATVTDRVSVRKVRNDMGNLDGVRPVSVTVRLLADGADTGRSLTLSAANDWRGDFTGLAASPNVTYAVSEDPVARYTTTVAGDAVSGFTVTNTHTSSTPPIIPVTPLPPAPTGRMCTITYDLNGGSYRGSTANIYETYPLGTTISIHEAPVREGYRFTYWRGSEYRPNDRYTVVGDHTFVAQWESEALPVPATPVPPVTPTVPATPATSATPVDTVPQTVETVVVTTPGTVVTPAAGALSATSDETRWPSALAVAGLALLALGAVRVMRGRRRT